MLTGMDLAAASAGPWLVLGVVVGLVLAGALALAFAAARRTRRSSAGASATEPAQPEPPEGWVEDDLPGFLEHPPGVATEARPPAPQAPATDPPLAAPEPRPSARRRVPASAMRWSASC